ncbi:MAG: glycosyltransferase family 2 protein [Lentisphaerae bacterium]|nr:glycosyltransferase family 2 protein [Lentisphaerota bacterium]
MRERISACITAGNEENNIRRCLESVKWVDEIVVVDSFSTDRTVAICKEYTDLVYQHKWLGYIGQKNLIKDFASGPWILFIDADEEVSDQLRDEILGEFESGSNKNYAGYEFPRLVRYLGRWITHGDWYPDAKLRLFRKALGTCGGQEPHDRTTVNGAVKRLSGNLYHYTYTGISDQLSTINKFSSITAESLDNEHASFKIFNLIFRPWFKFIRCYFLKRGFLDGLPGLIIAVTTAYGVFAKYAKLWERQKIGTV